MNNSLTVFALIAGCASHLAAASTCQDLASFKLPDTSVTLAQTVEAGAFVPPPNTGVSPSTLKNMPAFCRVAGVMKPSSDSEINFEVWMPSAAWNGKLQGVGNGGFAGSIPYAAMGAPLTIGYVVAATDTGHSGADASWALGHPEKVIDFGYRAIHETSVKAKAFVKAFYSRSPAHSYFNSCSNGGRQGLMEAQRYPLDYDGIIAGAPANYWTHLTAGFAWNQLMLSDPANFIPPAKLKTIEAAVLAACDERDGVRDGVLDDPPKCRFDPAVLLCQGAESDQCLTAAQAATLRKIYEGPRTSQGKQIFPGYEPGGETGPGGWQRLLTGAAPGTSGEFTFASQFFSGMVFQNREWDLKTFNLDRDTAAADQKTGAILNAIDPNLKPFQDRGGKLILYHGWSDPAIAPENTINYYQSVASKLGQAQTDRFVSLYMAPGMQHCIGGPGPSNFGQWGDRGKDAQHDIVWSLENWVEQGVKPGAIIATDASRTRPLCAYPLVARWSGKGSSDDAANFTCVHASEPRASASGR